MTENELSNIVIREAIKVHQELGPGLLESVYVECLFHRPVNVPLSVERQKPISLIFDDIKLDCGFRCETVVERKLSIEVKAIEALHHIHLAQVLTYLKLTDTRLRLLMNFNGLKLRKE